MEPPRYRPDLWRRELGARIVELEKQRTAAPPKPDEDWPAPTAEDEQWEKENAASIRTTFGRVPKIGPTTTAGQAVAIMYAEGHRAQARRDRGDGSPFDD